MRLEEAFAKRSGGADQAQFAGAFKRFVEEIVKYAEEKAREDVYDKGYDYGGESPEEDLPHAMVNHAVSETLSLGERLLDAVKEKVATTPEIKKAWEGMLSDVYRDMSRGM